ncbi:MAG TPA: N-acetylglucosamine-6-phosphate deacetylase [Candidatus Acidoferrum sp.]|nr:N-acetylglucosamine-6-phosphate deacetylase [Candidatus Acidoferrum sp.]
MATILIHSGRALTPTNEISDAGILIREGVIEALGPRSSMSLPTGATEIRATEQTAVPGFIDIHIHGAGGRDVMEATPEALGALTRKVAEFGTTSVLATTVTARPDDICRAASGISRYIAEQHGTAERRAEVLGLHFEGPFISKARPGVHPVEWIQAPSADLLERFVQAAAGNARLLTIAPEVLGAAPCIEAARKAGLVVSVGHTDANYEQTRLAIAHGARSATHTYNAMRPFTHRDPGVIGAVLTSPEINAELIADGVHVEEGAMKLLLQAKGPDRVILVSDGLSATGMPDGKYTLGGFEITVSNGVCRNAAGILAGSTLTLDRALRNIVNLGIPLASAVRMLTTNPASLLGIEFKKGALRVGADADILLLDQGLRVTNVWTRGLPLHESA